ncbi:hypothetical protein [Parerythrobacter aestuarii]|uniref:hypothetical protein n=1 Tax=Parerythrobacter aestuarii TaxID=3020909 RepID=UPI0024DE2442|nr:hypothetical protein [Parerythrobacter aestuarii]
MGEFDVIRVGQGAANGRLARCIRESEAGWLFYSPTGTAYHIFAEEAERLARQGEAAIERSTRNAILSRKLYRAMIPLAFAILLTDAFYLRLEGEFAGLETGPFIFTCMVIGSIVLAMFHPLLAMIYRGTGFILWQAKIAHNLRRQRRGGVSSAIEARHMRFNLFRILSMAALVPLVFRLAYYFFVVPVGHYREYFGWADLALAGVFFWAAIPAFLIDHTHRRRKWLD